MPVKLTSAAPGEWPAHLAPIGAGAPKTPIGSLLRERHRQREHRMVLAALRRVPVGEIAECEVWTGRQREAQLIAEAEREAARRRG